MLVTTEGGWELGQRLDCGWDRAWGVGGGAELDEGMSLEVKVQVGQEQRWKSGLGYEILSQDDWLLKVRTQVVRSEKVKKSRKIGGPVDED